MSKITNKRILIIGEEGSGKEEIVDSLIKREKNYILYEDIENLKIVEGVLKKFDYKTIIVSTNKLRKKEETREYDYILFLKNRNKKTIEVAKELGIRKIEEMEKMEVKTYKRDYRREAEEIVRRYKEVQK
ncbi:hypothetical protein PT447_00005 [Aliarcobacter butzleri]|uniref:hypothetical protein n=1 Tax=Aliarcobacter butzleri TaxID=28197 RepID=UPI0024DECED6|nr:hypothetical protein [Aliarcobacter butzleri]MDK2063301.1 hypothetical protein [Aliarcobacter butzleri]